MAFWEKTSHKMKKNMRKSDLPVLGHIQKCDIKHAFISAFVVGKHRLKGAGPLTQLNWSSGHPFRDKVHKQILHFLLTWLEQTHHNAQVRAQSSHTLLLLSCRSRCFNILMIFLSEGLPPWKQQRTQCHHACLLGTVVNQEPAHSMGPAI